MKSSNNLVGIGVVNKVSYSDQFPQGTITYQLLNGGNTGFAAPKNPNFKSYPLEGELVVVFNMSQYLNKISTANNGINTFYFPSGINIWNNPSLNALNISNQISDASSSFYYNPEKTKDITPLQSFPGDTILEGNFGNSIRLGNTYNNPSLGNNWSGNGENGDPITIIRNGQGLNKQKTENLINDHSSIYLTSTQKLNNFKIANDAFSSYTTIPTLPSVYSDPQVVINSNRVIINSKKDSTLISGENSVSLSSNKSINLESREIYMEGIDVKIGSKNASEPALLGDETVKLLINLTEQIKKLGEIASTNQIFPNGVPTPDAGSNTIGKNISSICDNILSKLKDNKRGIKSNFVKIR